jgi:hypothetical protein
MMSDHIDFGVWRKGTTAEEDTFGKSGLESPSSARCNLGDRIRNEADVSGTIRKYALISRMKFLEGWEIVTPSILVYVFRSLIEEPMSEREVYLELTLISALVIYLTHD